MLSVQALTVDLPSHGETTGNQTPRHHFLHPDIVSRVVCHVSQLRIHSIVECGKKPPVLLPSTGGAPIDPAVFGYIRVSQAKVANSLGRVQPCHQRPFYVPPLRPLTGKSVLRTGVVRGITDS